MQDETTQDTLLQPKQRQEDDVHDDDSQLDTWTESAEIIQIKCGLFPSVPIFVSFHKNLPASGPHSASMISQRISYHLHDYLDRDNCVDGDLSEEEDLNDLVGNRFAIVDASKIISWNHISVAIHTALLRRRSYSSQQSMCPKLDTDCNKVTTPPAAAAVTAVTATNTNTASDPDNHDNSTNNNSNSNRMRGTALDSIICAAGSTHVASILKDYAFLPTTCTKNNKNGDGNDNNNHHHGRRDNNTIPNNQQDNTHVYNQDTTSSNHHILVIGIHTSKQEFAQVLQHKELGLGLYPPETLESLEEYLSRPKSEEEITSLIKTYKTTREEVDMQGLENAILHRVATKFYT